jgi:hypothetical protein
MKKGGKQEEKKGRRTDSLNQEDIYGIQNWFYNVLQYFTINLNLTQN